LPTIAQNHRPRSFRMTAHDGPEYARSESPSTDRFYSLAALSLRAGDEYDDFRRRVLSLAAIPAAPTNL
ncbi:XcyI family restriction endonuclease, partial [Igneacidithiobacillus copahuensis]